MEYLAHIAPNGERQTVKEHLEQTAGQAASFAQSFGAAEWGRFVGLLHDIGKYSDKFQRHITHPELPIRVDHSTAGAQQALRLGALPAAFAIAGHHGGLPNGGTKHDDHDTPTLNGRRKRSVEDCSAWQQEIAAPPPPAALPFPAKTNCDWAFFTKMLHSCLVDADYLDTERFMRPDEHGRNAGASLAALRQRVRGQADRWLSVPGTTTLNGYRNQILRGCIQQGETLDRGLYTLTVPTGGGKTFASLAFALEHALHCGMERVIYVIPYTSIIDQTAAVFSDLLGEENVLAHYSGAEYQLSEQQTADEAARRKALAAENWDAPVIVTTAVQFFESLYASRPSRCRKLHNVANSVIVFDEAQTLPVPYLRPCVAAIAQLVQHYRATAVLCTATQPALQPLLDEFYPGKPVPELCPGSVQLYDALRRTTLQDLGTIPEADLTERLCAHPQVLCVVNRRKQAQALFRALPEEGRYCLTTLLCPADRKARLAEIRDRLRRGLPCRVVSTSLIEAGVDVDFPAAYREQAGLDSILQTAGRCNREGKRPAGESLVSIFALEGQPTPRMLKQNVAALRTAQRQCSQLDSPQAIRTYFATLLYVLKDPKTALDAKGILPALEQGLPDKGAFPFDEVAERFRLIESPTRDIYLPVGPGAALCEQLRAGLYSRSLMRRLGQYTVTVYPDHFAALDRAGALTLLEDGSAILADLRQYDPHTGLALDAEDGQGWFI